MVKSAEIRNRLIDHLVGRLSLKDFEAWLVSSSWDMPKARWSDARELIAEFELRLAEFSLGHLSEDQLRQELLEFVRGNIIVSDFSPRAYASVLLGSRSSSSAKSSDFRWNFPQARPAGMQFVRAPA